MEFKVTKDIRSDPDFQKHRDEFYKYMACLQTSNDPLVQGLAQWAFDAEEKQFMVLLNHLVSLDREIERLNKELVFNGVE